MARALSSLFRGRGLGGTPCRLVTPLPSLEAADPAVADAIYAGTFTLAGETLEADRGSPFALEPPSQAFAAELHGFSFLTGLASARTRVARANAAALVEDWVAEERALPAIALAPRTTARRLTAFLAAAPDLLTEDDPAFARLLLEAAWRDTRRLEAFLKRGSDAPERLEAAIAFLAATHALDAPERSAWRARTALAEEIERQVLPDGGHVSRSPLALLEVLAALLPALEVVEARGIPRDADPAPLAAVAGQVDRMLPMLAFFRHPDGSLARFNGVGATPFPRLEAVSAAADPEARAPANARYSGYQRVEAGDLVLLMETGPAPPKPFAGTAHAGCLSFEASDRGRPIVVNCGVPAGAGPDWLAATRTTAAHSTLVVADTASGRFRTADGPLLDGPATVPVERLERGGRTIVVAGHDGYRRKFGLVHRRALQVSADGTVVSGRDSLFGPGASEDVSFAIRFHLHPDVKTSLSPSRRAVLLTVGTGGIWRLSVEADAAVDVEPSIHVDPADGRARATRQVVISATTGTADVVRWRLERQLSA